MINRTFFHKRLSKTYRSYRHFCRNHLQVLQNTIPFKGHSDGITVVSWQGPPFHRKLVHRTRKSWNMFWSTAFSGRISTHKMWRGHLGEWNSMEFVWWWAPGGLKKVSFRTVLEQSSYNSFEHRMMMVAYQNPIVSNKKRVETSKETCWEPSEPFASWETRKRQPLTFHYAGCLIGILIMVYYIWPHYNISPT